MERLTEKHYRSNDGYYMVCSGNCYNPVGACDDCPEFEKIVDRLGAYEDTALTPEQVPKWIPVTERLPDHVGVIATDGKRVYLTNGSWFYKNEKGRIRIPANYGAGADVTHWMPLPEPPKMESEV